MLLSDTMFSRIVENLVAKDSHNPHGILQRSLGLGKIEVSCWSRAGWLSTRGVKLGPTKLDNGGLPELWQQSLTSS